MFATKTSSWTPIGLIAVVLFGVFLALGYGLIGLFILFVLGAMAGGALLYWLDGEGEP